MNKENSLKLLKKAAASFMKGEYKRAMFYFGAVLEDDPENKEARMGMILSEMANRDSDEAQAIYEFYISLKENSKNSAEKIIEDFIDSMENEKSFVDDVIEDGFYEMENAVSYDDFKELVKSRGSFKEAFEDIMFSTKVIISKRDDFLDFLENLIENRFNDIAFAYLEDLSKLNMADPKIYKLFEKIKPMKLQNDS